MLVYVSGPYTGEVGKNIEKAKKVAVELWEKGHAVFCPHLNTAFFEKCCQAKYEDYLKGDLLILSFCDAVVLLPNWKDSDGARTEKEYAEKLGIPIYFYPRIPELHPTEVQYPNQVRAFREILGQMYRISLKKNADYSAANILGTGEIGLVTRLWDKIARLLNLTGFHLKIEEPAEFIMPQEPQNESIVESYIDGANYAVIGQILRRRLWGK